MNVKVHVVKDGLMDENLIRGLDGDCHVLLILEEIKKTTDKMFRYYFMLPELLISSKSLPEKPLNTIYKILESEEIFESLCIYVRPAIDGMAGWEDGMKLYATVSRAEDGAVIVHK